MSYYLCSIVRCTLVALLLGSFVLPAAAQEQEAQLAEAHRLNQQAIQLYQAGRYAEAVPLAQNALAILEKALGPEHPYVAASLNNLALLYQAQGDYGRAAPLLQRSLAIYEKALGPEHPNVATELDNLGGLYREQGDYGRAAPLYQRALAIQEKALGPEHPDVAASLNNLALLYRAQGDYGRAAPLFQRALAIEEKALGPEHPDVATTLSNLAFQYLALNDYKRAVSFLQRASAVEEKNIAQILNAGSQQQKQLYLNTLFGRTNATIRLHAGFVPQNADAARLALTVILQRKGRALDATSDQIAALRRRAAPNDQKLLDQLTAVQSQFATLQLSNTGKLSPEARRAEITRLNAEQERLEDAIGRSSAEFRAVAQPITLDAVRQAVPPDAALVELFIYQPFNAQAKTHAEGFGTRYVAYVLRRADDVPQFVDLGESATIDADAARFRAVLQTADTPEAQVKELARNLDERVMRPVRKLLGPTMRVFLAPDGALNLVPFDAFVDEDGHYLIENYSFNYLTSGRDLLRLQVAGQSQDAPTIVANPLFDTKSAAAAPANRRRAIGLLGAGETANAEARTIDFTALYYPPLTGTAAEAKSIGALWPQARVWTQGDATEATLKRVNRPRILHIATHGFFLPDQPTTKPDESRGLGLNAEVQPRGPQQENPMLRSGLILAGVNQKQSGAGEDGVLTAQEAAGLNLFGTKLVVLSACETGLGDVQNGAGVYGLRRALVLAGSETQVMSLWQVSDAATRDLMIAYYTRLQSGAGRIAALRQVQLAMLHGTTLATSGDAKRNLGLEPHAPQPQGRQLGLDQAADITAKTNWRHPYYWAAFIPSGEWTTLDGREPK